jgi:hypothetical protein
MRSDLGRLAAIAEILQIGPFLSASRRAWRCGLGNAMFSENAGSIRMRIFGAQIFGAAVMIALLAGPSHAQSPHINLLADQPSKTPEEKEAEAARDKAYKDSLRKIPEVKTSADPWGTVRTTDAPKTTAPAKPRTKTGSTAN